MNIKCESDQLFFCGIVTYEASLAWCDDVVVFEPPVQRSLIILSTSFPKHDISDIGLLLDGALFGLFFFSKGIRTAVFQSFGSFPVFHVMLMSLK